MGSDSGSRSRRHSSPAKAEPSPFVKIILPEAVDGKKLVRPSFPEPLTCCLVTEKMQRIPNESIKRFGNELSSVATVTVPDGLVWKMGLKKSASEVWFCDGWQEFVKYYSISYGSFLVFKYEGNSTFCVFIFDMTAVEIYYPCKNLSNSGEPNFENRHSECPRKKSSLYRCGYYTRSKRRKVENQEEIIDLDNVNSPSHGKSRMNVSYNLHEHSGKHGNERYRQGHTERMSLSSKLENQEEIIDVEKFTSPRRGKSRKNASFNPHEHSRKDAKDIYRQGHTEKMSQSSSKMESLTLKKKQRSIEAAQKFNPKNPSFTAIIKPFNMTERYLHVPASFDAKYLRKMNSIKLQNSNGQQWVVHCNHPNGRFSTTRLQKGWINFARDNHLKEGDVCVFEIIKRKSVVLEVTIFPCF